MGLVNTSDFRRGVHIEVEGEPYTLVEVEKHGPTGRGGKTLVRVKMRNIKTGQLVDRAIKAGESFPEPDLEEQAATFSYASPDALTFLDAATYEPVEVPRELFGDEVIFITDGLGVKVRRYNGQIIAVELPQYVDLRVESVVPGTRGNTASGSVTTPATLEGGAVVDVPLFIKAGDRVRVDPREGTFRERAE
jgi:elongation factor P